MSDLYTYKVAEHEWEYELIFKLNYDTFVKEIPQHPESETARLVDKFHDENKYFICLDKNELIGMVAVRNVRPFSLDQKISNLDSYFPQDTSKGEVRLLCVQKNKRAGGITANLIKMTRDWCYEEKLDIILISGVTRQIQLYKKLGFLAFGPLVGGGDAWFQPMYITRESFIYKAPDVVRQDELEEGTDRIVNFLPGPVYHEPHIKEALVFPALTHRGLDYQLWLHRVKWQLNRMTYTKHVEIFTGTGTLANDVIAGQLKQLNQQGLILINGEFGQRLVQNAKGFNLNFIEYSCPLGEEFNYDQITTLIKKNPTISWIWLVHLETSTGLANDFQRIIHLANKFNIKVCLDGISALGNLKTDYSGTYLASSVSGKGLCSYTGLSMVFYNHDLKSPQFAIPEYLNLYRYHQREGIPFSGSSNLLHALYTSLESFDLEKRLDAIQKTYEALMDKLEDSPFICLKPQGEASVMINIVIPMEVSSVRLGRLLEQKGYLLHFRSQYLISKNLIQIALMTELSFTSYIDMLEALKGSFRELQAT